MIRSAAPGDTGPVVDTLVAANMFDDDDRPFLEELFADYFGSNSHEGHVLLVDDHDGAVQGLAYIKPMAAADRVWDLTMIAVLPSQQGRGRGSQLISFAEDALRDRGERLLIVETSATAQYDQARDFYTKLGYTEEARVRDYWADGDDKVVFSKRLIA
ncbi:N-acetyltransferase [soil metagenome]